MALRFSRRFVSATLFCLVALCLLMAGASPAWAAGEPLATDPYAHAATTTLKDGSYLMDVAMEGGTGRASVTSPASVKVVGGKAVATLEWSSSHYDYMLVAGECYLPVNESGNSVFEVPILAFDEPFSVVADTTAMSQPHEIEYQLTFDSASAAAVTTGATNGSLPLTALGVALLAAVIAAMCARAFAKKR